MPQEGRQHLAGVAEGDILAGKYRVERVLGIGGMGVVVAAHHLRLDEKVALKFLLPEALDNSEAVARFAREARAAVKIKSEHVARVTDVGTLPNGAPFMVMEYLEGGDLAAWVKQRGAMPIEQAVEFLLQACVAVADAHALGIVHRDLKPANLFCVRRSDGQLSIKVLDFGISKLTVRGGSWTRTAEGMAFTKTSVLMGSPLYMSPEQMQSSKGVDARTDIWALGVILFELITGRAPFLAETVTELAIKIATEPTPAVRAFLPGVPAALEAVVAKCLEKDARRRYRFVAELALALLPFAPKRAKTLVDRISGIHNESGLSASASDALPSAQLSGTQTHAAGTLPAVGRTTLGTKGGKTVVAMGGLAALGALATVALFVFFQKPKPADSLVVPNPPVSAAGAAASPPVSIAPSVALPAPLAVAPATVEAAPVGPSATASAFRAPAVALPASTAAKKTKSPGVTPPATAAPPPAKPPATDANCNPPYYFDARGNRIFKPECL